MDKLEEATLGDIITLNGKVWAKEKFLEKVRKLDKQKDVTLVEVGPNEYKIQLKG